MSLRTCTGPPPSAGLRRTARRRTSMPRSIGVFQIDLVYGTGPHARPCSTWNQCAFRHIAPGLSRPAAPRRSTMIATRHGPIDHRWDTVRDRSPPGARERPIAPRAAARRRRATWASSFHNTPATGEMASRPWHPGLVRDRTGATLRIAPVVSKRSRQHPSKPHVRPFHAHTAPSIQRPPHPVARRHATDSIASNTITALHHRTVPRETAPAPAARTSTCACTSLDVRPTSVALCRQRGCVTA